MKKQALIIALKYGVGFGLLAGIIAWHWHDQSADGQEIGLAAALERPINGMAAAVAFACCTASILISFVRWRLLVRAQDLPFTMGSALRLGSIGLYWNTFLPGSIGGDIIKAAFLAREQSRRTVAIATILFDRVVGLCGLIWLITLLGSVLNLTNVGAASLTPPAQTAVRGILLTAAGIALGSLAFWFVMGAVSPRWADDMAGRLERIPKVGLSTAELWRAAWLYRRRTPAVMLALLLSIASHAGFVFTFYFSAQVMTPPAELPSLAAHFVIVPAGMTFQAFFPTPNGVGGGEIGFGGLYELIGFAFVAGALASLVQRVVMWAIAMVGYIVYLRMKATHPTASIVAAEPAKQGETLQ
ncbi:MAG: flippase-like domain-containing protein [Gemmataceae bacterium]|nr:flippase-like domain-containing protein [Gemmataceae bacterium]